MRDGAATRRRIAEEALRLFSAKGVDATSVRDIAAAAGIREGTIYVHFRSKDDLAAAIFRDGYAAYARRLRAVATGPGPFPERLAALAAAVCGLCEDDPVLFNFLLVAQHRHLGAVPRDGDNPVDVVQRMLAAAMESGDIPARDPALASAMVVGVLVQAATFRLYGRLSSGLAECADELAAACARVVS